MKDQPRHVLVPKVGTFSVYTIKTINFQTQYTKNECLIVMGRSSVRSLKTARTDLFLPGPDRPKTDPKRPKDRGLFSVFFLGENTPIFSQFSMKFSFF